MEYAPPPTPLTEIPKPSEHLALPKFDTYDALLINVPVDFQQGPIADGEEPPFGLGRIAAVANEYFGLQVGILDAHRIHQDGHRLSLDGLRQQLLAIKKHSSPGFVAGINPTNVNLEAGIEVANLLDEVDIPYVVGGYFATLSEAKTVFDNFPRAVGFIPRHGEVAFSSVVASRVDGKSTNSIPGFYTQDEMVQPRTPFGRRIVPIHAPPLNQLEYFHDPFTSLELGDKTYTEASTYMTDGCPFECGFCSSPYMKERRYDRPTMNQIVDEVERLTSQGADAIHFLDDLVFIQEKDIIEFHSELSRRGLLAKQGESPKFVWRGMGRANLIDRWSDETMKMLKDTGCWQLAIGVENGSPRILEFVKKKIDPDLVLRATEKNTRFGIGTKGFFIFGFPTETEAEMQQSHDLALEMAKRGATSIAAFEFHPYPGTDLYYWISQNRPEILERLTYLATDRTEIGQDNEIGVASKANLNKTGMWLPEDLCVAEENSGRVRQFVQSTIDDFHQEIERRGGK